MQIYVRRTLAVDGRVAIQRQALGIARSGGDDYFQAGRCERALQDFRTRNATVPGDAILSRAAGSSNSYSDLLARRDAAWRQRTELERVLASSPDSMMTDAELEAMAAAAPTGELSNILKELSTKRSRSRAI